MREILFRGKRIENNQWIKGTLIATTAVHTKYYIVDSCWCESQRITEKGCADFNWIEAYEVIPETIGQYTGLIDKNGTKIFEGDICKHRSNYSGNFIISIVTYTDGQFLAITDNNSGFNLSDNLEVIGNIHDNPELLKECEGK